MLDLRSFALVFVVLASSQQSHAQDEGKKTSPRAFPDAQKLIIARPDDPTQGDEHPRRLDDPHASYVEDGAGPRLALGRAFHHDLPDGWYGRFETEYFEQRAHGPRRRRGSLWGTRLGLEGWGSSQDWGFGLPLTVYGGYRQPLVRSRRGLDLFGAVGAGVDVCTFDHVDDALGMGVFTPRAELVLGVDLGGIRLLTDGGAQYRWHFTQHDFVQLRAGIAISLHSELWDG